MIRPSIIQLAGGMLSTLVSARIKGTHLYRYVMAEKAPTRPVESGMLGGKPAAGGDGCLKWIRKSGFEEPSSLMVRAYARLPESGIIAGVP